MACGAVEVGGRGGAALPHLLLGRAGLRGGGAGALRRGALARCWSSGRARSAAGAYGLEALNVLRIEKGLLTHAELHGRTTADDLGLGRMLAAARTASARRARRGRGWPGRSASSSSACRPLATGRAAARPGRTCSSAGAAFTAANDLGYLTSRCFSPTLGHDIALGFVRGRAGADRRAGAGGLRAARARRRPARSCRRCFVDPEGGGCVAELAADERGLRRPRAAARGGRRARCAALPATVAGGRCRGRVEPGRRRRGLPPLGRAGSWRWSRSAVAGRGRDGAARRSAASTGLGGRAVADGRDVLGGAAVDLERAGGAARCSRRLVPLDLDARGRFAARRRAARSLLRRCCVRLRPRSPPERRVRRSSSPRSYARTAVDELAAASARPMRRRAGVDTGARAAIRRAPAVRLGRRADLAFVDPARGSLSAGETRQRRRRDLLRRGRPT